MVLAAQYASGKRRPGHQPELERLRHGDEFSFHSALAQGIFDLQSGEAAPAAQLCESVCLCNPPCRCIGYPDIENLSLSNQVIECSHDFVNGGHLIPNVQPIEINVIGLQSP